MVFLGWEDILINRVGRRFECRAVSLFPNVCGIGAVDAVCKKYIYYIFYLFCCLFDDIACCNPF